MYDWTEDRYACIEYLLSTSDHHWSFLNRLPDSQLTDMVRHDLELDNDLPKVWNK